jgi:hypothetical protein
MTPVGIPASVLKNRRVVFNIKGNDYRLAERIDGEPLLARRRGFDAARHAAPKPPPRRRSPFAD